LLGGEVLRFAGVFDEIVELVFFATLAAFAFDELPRPEAHGEGVVARVALQHGELADGFLQRLATLRGQDAEGVAAFALRQSHLHDGCGRREQVGEADRLVRDRARRDLARPACDERHAMPALERRAFAVVPGAVGHRGRWSQGPRCGRRAWPF
jgi:hypothetical protein